MKKARKIAVVVTWYGSGAQVLRGVSEFAEEHPCWILHLLYSGSPFIMEEIEQLNPDGVISQIVDVGAGPLSHFYKCPWVSVMAQQGEAPFVTLDEGVISRLVAKHYTDRRFRNFAFLGNSEYEFSIQRAAAFESALQGMGISCLTHLYPTKISATDLKRRRAVDCEKLQWLENLPKPVAVFACDDWEAFQFIQFCRQHNFRVPDEVAVMGVGNDELLCGISNPPISSIRAPFEQIGYEAASLLDQLLCGGKIKTSGNFLSAVTLVTRRSTDVLQVSDPVVVKALHFIQQHIAEPIKVKDVLRHAFVSRTLLEQKFRAELGRSPLEEIRRQRVQRAKEMLADTTLLITEIAEACGFSSDARLSTVFKELTGIPPSEFRSKVNAGS